MAISKFKSRIFSKKYTNRNNNNNNNNTNATQKDVNKMNKRRLKKRSMMSMRGGAKIRIVSEQPKKDLSQGKRGSASSLNEGYQGSRRSSSSSRRSSSISIGRPSGSSEINTSEVSRALSRRPSVGSVTLDPNILNRGPHDVKWLKETVDNPNPFKEDNNLAGKLESALEAKEKQAEQAHGEKIRERARRPIALKKKHKKNKKQKKKE